MSELAGEYEVELARYCAQLFLQAGGRIKIKTNKFISYSIKIFRARPRDSKASHQPRVCSWSASRRWG